MLLEEVFTVFVSILFVLSVFFDVYGIQKSAFSKHCYLARSVSQAPDGHHIHPVLSAVGVLTHAYQLRCHDTYFFILFTHLEKKSFTNLDNSLPSSIISTSVSLNDQRRHSIKHSPYYPCSTARVSRRCPASDGIYILSF